jgi:hypothetical protein
MLNLLVAEVWVAATRHAGPESPSAPEDRSRSTGSRHRQRVRRVAPR